MGIQGALGGQGLNIMSLNKKKYSSENSIDRHSKGPDAHQSFCSAMSNYILHNSQAGSDHFTAALCFMGPKRVGEFSKYDYSTRNLAFDRSLFFTRQ